MSDNVRVGLTMYIQNYNDWDRFNALEKGDAPPLEPNTDASIWAEEIESALKAEELGFDSIWTVEHHVSPYTMVTNPVQFLTFLAGATSKVQLGTMVVVLPWHDPLRVAEDITMLQNVLRGRRAFIGFGRGLGRREFKALRIDQNESRQRFAEGIEVIKLALSQEAFEYHGDIYDYDRTTMRPRPRDAAQLIDDFCFSWGSPSSAPIGASHGLRPLVIPQKAFEEYHADLAEFSKARAEAGHAPARPRIHLHMFCDPDHDKAEEWARRAIPEYVDSATRNYELRSDHFKDIKGYEHYAGMTQVPKDYMAQAWIDNCVWGTPEECIQKIQVLCDAFHPEEFMLTGRYGSIPADVAQSSIDLFAREVLPAVHEISLEEPISYEATAGAGV
jgi:alkanesulfonate monooxygenase SsuD/methylene tetrahydromethanopterin reductase-like flavin-dependent oxidoreductase (luciferase family)